MAACITPLRMTDKKAGCERVFPCGRCPPCKARRTSGWSFRLMQEDKKALSSMFITLTYDTDHVPITKNKFMSLQKTDLQKFFKRLRKAHDKTYPDIDLPKIKYYAVGEYGGKTNRPHYHIILFNADIKLIQDAWAIDDKHIGQVHYGNVSGASVGYTLKYISKKSKIPMHANDDRQKEFSLMSKGLGEEYLSNAMVQWHKNDLNNRMYCNLEDGKKVSMPRYYKDKIYSERERVDISYFMKKKMEDEAEKTAIENGIYKEFNNTYEHNQIQAHKASFERMEYKAQKDDKL